MFKTGLDQPSRIVQLSDQIKVETDFRETHLPALRSGFAGYPANPRWNGSKFVAWKTGRHWRQALQTGTVVVRQSDSMLVVAGDECQATEGTTSTTDDVDSRPLLACFNFANQIMRFYAPQSSV
jgi:hypothetical protein